MNWFTETVVSNKTKEEKDKIARKLLDNCCDHVNEGSQPLYGYKAEHDSFGFESYGMCEACWTEAKEQEMKEEITCRDCKKRHPKSEVLLWKWYDFYAAQGDEPIPVCHGCLKKPVHQARMKQDLEDYEWEFRRDNKNNEDDDRYW